MAHNYEVKKCNYCEGFTPFCCNRDCPSSEMVPWWTNSTRFEWKLGFWQYGYVCGTEGRPLPTHLIDCKTTQLGWRIGNEKRIAWIRLENEKIAASEARRKAEAEWEAFLEDAADRAVETNYSYHRYEY